MKRQAEVFENPLVPHAVLRRMYDGMKTLRGLEPRAAQNAVGRQSLRGEEACRASSLLSLAAGDLLSDVPGSAVMAQRRGAAAMEAMAPGALVLSPSEDAAEQLAVALGAASALRAQGAGRLVLLYVYAEDVPVTAWKRSLAIAGRRELPILFLVLPSKGVRGSGLVSERALGWGVPGIPVDAADAVALYRVVQESVLRARSGDGPALIECVRWQPAGAAAPGLDGVEALRRVLLDRGLLPGRARRTAALPEVKSSTGKRT